VAGTGWLRQKRPWAYGVSSATSLSPIYLPSSRHVAGLLASILAHLHDGRTCSSTYAQKGFCLGVRCIALVSRHLPHILFPGRLPGTFLLYPMPICRTICTLLCYRLSKHIPTGSVDYTRAVLTLAACWPLQPGVLPFCGRGELAFLYLVLCRADLRYLYAAGPLLARFVPGARGRSAPTNRSVAQSHQDSFWCDKPGGT